MADDRKAARMANLDRWRSKTFVLGVPLGSLISRTFEAIQTVVRDGTKNEMSVTYALESLSKEREHALSRDPERDDPQRQLMYGLTESIVEMIQSVLEERRSESQEREPEEDNWANSSQDDCLSDATLPKFSSVDAWKVEDSGIEIITLDDDQPSCSSNQAASSNEPHLQSTIGSAYQARVGGASTSGATLAAAAAALRFSCSKCVLAFATPHELTLHQQHHSFTLCMKCKTNVPYLERMQHMDFCTPVIAVRRKRKKKWGWPEGEDKTYQPPEYKRKASAAAPAATAANSSDPFAFQE